MQFFESLNEGIERVAAAYEAKRAKYIADPKQFQEETRGDIIFSIKPDNLPKVVVKTLPKVLTQALPETMGTHLEYTMWEDIQNQQLQMRVDSGKIASPAIEEFPDFPTKEILAKLKSAELQVGSGWIKQPSDTFSIIKRAAKGEPPPEPERSHNYSLVKRFPEANGEMPFAVIMLHAMAQAAFPFDEETHLSQYIKGAQGHNFPGDAAIARVVNGDSTEWIVAFSCDDSLGRNPKADNVLDLLRFRANTQTPVR